MPKTSEKKHFFGIPLIILFVIALAVASHYGARFFLYFSWLASLGSARNVSVVLFRIGMVPLFALVFSLLAVVHSWLGSSRERHNKGFLIFKFLFFFVSICIAEAFLRISESVVYAVMAGFTGVKDSLFQIDMSWYLFWIPLIKKISLFMIFYFSSLFIFRVSYPGGQKKFAYGKLSLCAFSFFSIVFLLITYSQYLSTRSMPGSDSFLGYADIFGHMLPLAISLIWTWLFLAGSLYLFRKRYRALLSGGVFTFFVLLICNVIWPFYLDRFILMPNKQAYENKYAGIHAENTRKAFGLQNLAFTENSGESTGRQNIFLMDRAMMLNQFQEEGNISGTLTFRTIAPALINGSPAYLSPRTLNAQSSDWESKYFANIYGYGVFAASASRTDENGGLLHMEAGVPLDHEEIFFDENFEDFVFINTKVPVPRYGKEGTEPSPRDFQGVSGIGVNFFHKMALTLSKKDMRFLFTGYYTPQTKLIYYRKPSQLAREILPYFEYSEPRAVYFNRSLWWEMDGYASSEDVFVAASVETPWGMKNWLRAPIRVYVNAYSGEVYFRRIDEKDPMVQVISKVFPQLFTKQIDPDSLAYPDTLFSIQSTLLRRYHETNEAAFYQGVDQREFSGNPETIIVSDSQTKMLGLAQNYSHKDRPGITSRLIASINEEGRSSIRIFRPPQGGLSAQQAEDVIRTSAEFQSLASLWSNLDILSKQGPLVSILTNDRVDYMQTLYTNSSSSGSPILAKIVSIQGTDVSIFDNSGLLFAFLQEEEKKEVEQKEEQNIASQDGLMQNLREAYFFYLEAEKARVLGNTQDYYENVDKMGEKLRQALN